MAVLILADVIALRAWPKICSMLHCSLVAAAIIARRAAITMCGAAVAQDQTKKPPIAVFWGMCLEEAIGKRGQDFPTDILSAKICTKVRATEAYSAARAHLSWVQLENHQVLAGPECRLNATDGSRSPAPSRIQPSGSRTYTPAMKIDVFNALQRSIIGAAGRTRSRCG